MQAIVCAPHKPHHIEFRNIAEPVPALLKAQLREFLFFIAQVLAVVAMATHHVQH